MLRANPENFFSRIITGDEAWDHFHDPETTQESMQWKHKGSPTPKKFREQQSAGKIKATVFFGLRRYSAFEIHATQDNHYWKHLLPQWWLYARISNKFRGKLSAGVLLLHNNAPAHKSSTSRAAIRKCGFVELNICPTDQTWLLVTTLSSETLKEILRGRRFPNDNAVKKAVTGYFDTQDVSFFSEGIRALEAKWTKCVE